MNLDHGRIREDLNTIRLLKVFTEKNETVEVKPGRAVTSSNVNMLSTLKA